MPWPLGMRAIWILSLSFWIASLTPEVIQFQAIQKLSDKIQIALIPSGQGVILDPTTLLGGVKK